MVARGRPVADWETKRRMGGITRFSREKNLGTRRIHKLSSAYLPLETPDPAKTKFIYRGDRLVPG